MRRRRHRLRLGGFFRSLLLGGFRGSGLLCIELCLLFRCGFLFGFVLREALEASGVQGAPVPSAAPGLMIATIFV